MVEDRIIELLTRKLAGEASAEEQYELDELLLQYPESAYLQDIILQIWKTEAEAEDPEAFYKRHKRRYQDDFKKMKGSEVEDRGYSRAKRLLVGTAAVLLIMAVVTYLLWEPATKTGGKILYTEIISGKGVRKRVTLPEGSIVWLNADSRIRFDADMNSGGSRTVTLSGEAFFDVKHIDHRPFYINTRQISIKVLGTAFNVKAYPEDQSCETTLIRGSIELVTNNTARQKFLLVPSEKLSLTDAKSRQGTAAKNTDPADGAASMRIDLVTPVKLSDKEYVPETSWIENKLIFTDEPLEQLAPKLERWFDVKINITSEALRAYRFTGVFTSETIGQALEAMKLIKQFRFTVYNKTITLY